MPSYSNIFQPETSFRTQIVDLENEDKKNLPDWHQSNRVLSSAEFSITRLKHFFIVVIPIPG